MGLKKKKKKRRKKETTTRAREMGVGSSMDSDLSHESMHGVLFKKMSLHTHQLEQEFKNI